MIKQPTDGLYVPVSMRQLYKWNMCDNHLCLIKKCQVFLKANIFSKKNINQLDEEI